MYALLVTAILMMLIGAVDLRQERNHAHMSDVADFDAMRAIHWHSSAVGFCQRSPCAPGAVNPTSAFDGAIQAGPKLALGNIRSFLFSQGGQTYVATVFAETAQPERERWGVIAALVAERVDGKMYVGPYDAASGRVWRTVVLKGGEVRNVSVVVPSPLGGFSILAGMPVLVTPIS